MNYKKIIQAFLEKPTNKQKLIVIYGPTGSGKTSMSIEIAKILQTEIISTDSRQIYTGMDIGTGKITLEETKGVKHHTIDMVKPDENFSVGDFKSKTLPIIEALHDMGKIPMLVGGTGLYINSIIFDYTLPKIPSDPELRRELSMLSLEQQYAYLQSIDPEYAEELHPNNRPYVERAIEVKTLTGKSKQEFREEKKLKYNVLFLTPYIGERGVLYNKINTRVVQMFKEGLEEEVKTLIKKGYKQTDQGMKSIGYQEFFPYFEGKITQEEVLQKIQQNSRNYAKRQLTWFGKYEKYKRED